MLLSVCVCVCVCVCTQAFAHVFCQYLNAVRVAALLTGKSMWPCLKIMPTLIAQLGFVILVIQCLPLYNKCKKLNSLKQCLTATRPTSHN